MTLNRVLTILGLVALGLLLFRFPSQQELNESQYKTCTARQAAMAVASKQNGGVSVATCPHP